MGGDATISQGGRRGGARAGRFCVVFSVMEGSE